MKINYSYFIEKKWLWWTAIVKHQQILELCNLLPNYCNIVDIVGRQCNVTMGVIGWTKSTLLSIGTKMVNMNFEQFHFMHRWFIRIELSCVALNWWTESKITNTHIHFLEHLQHTPLRSLILMQPYRSLSQASICHCELSIKLYICLFANR